MNWFTLFTEALTLCRVAFDPVELGKAVLAAEFSQPGLTSAVLAVANDEDKIFTTTNPMIRAIDLQVFHMIAKYLAVTLPPGT